MTNTTPMSALDIYFPPKLIMTLIISLESSPKDQFLGKTMETGIVNHLFLTIVYNCLVFTPLFYLGKQGLRGSDGSDGSRGPRGPPGKINYLQMNSDVAKI